ncbi:MAG: hypothetical protein ACTSY1_03610 [Alphaproteobacteria bacterium]
MAKQNQKSEHERIIQLEQQIESVLDSLVDLQEDQPPALAGLLAPTLLFPTISKTGLSNPGLYFALTPLPNSIGQGTGNKRCGSTTQVWKITTAGNYSIVVSAGSKSKCKVTIHHSRAGAVRNSSAIVAKGNSAGVGPFAAIVNDTIEVECSAGTGGNNKCLFQWQVNKI